MYFRKTNGPVPTGFHLISDGLPAFNNCAAYSADKIDAKEADKLGKNGA
jgi:hypothetical protein